MTLYITLHRESVTKPKDINPDDDVFIFLTSIVVLANLIDFSLKKLTQTIKKINIALSVHRHFFSYLDINILLVILTNSQIRVSFFS